ncbi:LuxR C-terminal-related transcriptional regulator [Sorangium sp. So ce1151]|uniref:LuxR C-terminal-related transcriptional regulator n=1 Tax=Sorangium sp. So ce1151 TaxID=3133332 RepID=UPI003F5F8920
MCMVTLLQGYVGASDAEELGAAEKTIKVHRGRVMEKLGVGSVAELVRLVDRLEQGP